MLVWEFTCSAYTETAPIIQEHSIDKARMNAKIFFHFLFSSKSPSLIFNSLVTQKCHLCKNNKQVPLGMHTLKFPFSLSCLLLITNEIISAYALQIWLKYQTLFIKYVTLKI